MNCSYFYIIIQFAGILQANWLLATNTSRFSYCQVTCSVISNSVNNHLIAVQFVFSLSEFSKTAKNCYLLCVYVCVRNSCF